LNAEPESPRVHKKGTSVGVGHVIPSFIAAAVSRATKLLTQNCVLQSASKRVLGKVAHIPKLEFGAKGTVESRQGVLTKKTEMKQHKMPRCLI
jgi:hypothetical protein